MSFEDAFKTICSRSEGIYKDKGSKFIAIACPVDSEEDVRQQLANLRNEFHDARHHCYAYILGSGKTVFRFNDDGEPSGTAGRPIFGQIQAKGLTNLLVVVVRYFGGVKLGVRGLINAYKNAAQSALENAQEIEKTVSLVYEVKFDYTQMNRIMKLMKDEVLNTINQNFNLSCTLQFSVARADSARILEKLADIKGLEISYIRTVSA
jgi:uncharacterized YigZ family protein